jgi:hypothetical protein
MGWSGNGRIENKLAVWCIHGRGEARNASCVEGGDDTYLPDNVRIADGVEEFKVSKYVLFFLLKVTDAGTKNCESALLLLLSGFP